MAGSYSLEKGSVYYVAGWLAGYTLTDHGSLSLTLVASLSVFYSLSLPQHNPQSLPYFMYIQIQNHRTTTSIYNCSCVRYVSVQF